MAPHPETPAALALVDRTGELQVHLAPLSPFALGVAAMRAGMLFGGPLLVAVATRMKFESLLLAAVVWVVVQVATFGLALVLNSDLDGDGGYLS